MKKAAVMIGAAVVALAEVAGHNSPAPQDNRAKLLKRAERTQDQIPRIKPPLSLEEAGDAVKKGEAAGYVSVALYWAEDAQKDLRGGSFRGDFNQFMLRNLKAREYLQKADTAKDPTAALILAFATESRLSYRHTAEEIAEKNAALTEKIEKLGKATKRENERLGGGGAAARAHSAAEEERFTYNTRCRLTGSADARRYYVALSDVESPALSFSSDEAVADVVAAFDRAVALGAEDAELHRERFKARVAAARQLYEKARAREKEEKARARLFEEVLD